MGDESGSDSEVDEGLMQLTDMRTAAQQLVGQRIRGNTAKDYKNKIKILSKWITVRMGSSVADHLIPGDPPLPKVPMNLNMAMSFFGELSDRRPDIHPIFGKIHKKTRANNGHPSASTLAGFKSAVVWWHQESGTVVDPELNRQLDMLIKGYKKRVGDWKQTGEMSALEGKCPLSFAGYQLLASEFIALAPDTSHSGNHRTSSSGMASTWSMGPFAWSFLLLQWNTIARSVSIGMIMLAHLSWKVIPQFSGFESRNFFYQNILNVLFMCPDSGRPSGDHHTTNQD